MFETLTKANEVLEKRNKQLDNANKLFEVLREIFKKLEQAIGRNKYRNLMNDVSKDNGRMIQVIRTLDKQIHPEEHQEQKDNQKRGRGMSR